MNKETLHNLFHYDNGLLRNKITRNARALKDNIAGSKHHSGYFQIQINGKLQLAHRIIWTMFHGKIPDNMVIDHINHVRDDNRIENLRLTCKIGNARNQSINSANTSGITGVYFIKRLKKWGSQIKVNKKVIWLGTHKTKTQALYARKHAEGIYNFHENHGGK